MYGRFGSADGHLCSPLPGIVLLYSIVFGSHGMIKLRIENKTKSTNYTYRCYRRICFQISLWCTEPWETPARPTCCCLSPPLGPCHIDFRWVVPNYGRVKRGSLLGIGLLPSWQRYDGPFSEFAPAISSCTFLLLTDGKFYFLICLSTHFNEVLHVFHYTVSSCTFQINSSECRLFTIETYGEQISEK